MKTITFTQAEIDLLIAIHEKKLKEVEFYKSEIKSLVENMSLQLESMNDKSDDPATETSIVLNITEQIDSFIASFMPEKRKKGLTNRVIEPIIPPEMSRDHKTNRYRPLVRMARISDHPLKRKEDRDSIS